MITSDKEALKQILYYCQGYEAEGRDVGKDYINLKEFIEREYDDLKAKQDKRRGENV